jgi:hypothetical protein
MAMDELFEVAPSETVDEVIAILGTTVSITKASLLPSEPDPPTVGSVSVALLLLLSLIVPPLSASADVDI